jgi:hypothetical protein
MTVTLNLTPEIEAGLLAQGNLVGKPGEGKPGEGKPGDGREVHVVFSVALANR